MNEKKTKGSSQKNKGGIEQDTHGSKEQKTKVSDIMSPDPISLDVSSTVAEAAQAMRKKDIGDVVIVEEDNLIGILTDRDIVVRCIAENRDPESTDVGSICSRDVTTLSPGDSIDFAWQLMKSHSIRRLPVVQQGHAVGIVSMGDLAKFSDPDSALSKVSEEVPNK